jgi:hypothetical protein
MNQSRDELEALWDGLLSRQEELMIKAFNSLDEEGKAAVMTHLNRMATEMGWHPEQAASAKSALDILKKHDLSKRPTSF